MGSVVPCTAMALAAMPVPPWSMLYMTALGPPGSALAILKTIRSSLPACSVPCHDPVRSWACAPAAIAQIPSAHSHRFFMRALYGSGAPGDHALGRSAAHL